MIIIIKNEIMILSKEDSGLFFKLYIPLLGYANQYDGKNKKRQLMDAREILYNNPQIVKDFILNNPEKFNKEEIEIINSWQKFIRGKFILIRSLKKYDVFLSFGKEERVKAYGFLGLNDEPINIAEYGIGTYFENVVLLPWKDKIIWDGLVCQKSIIFGKNYMRSFTEEYKKIKQVGEITERINLKGR